MQFILQLPPIYTWFRDFVYRNGNITSDRSRATRYSAELLAFNGVQTNLYWTQVAVAVGIRSVADPSVDFESEKIVNGAFEFFRNSWWLAFAGKWSMDAFRRFFGAKTPEQLADERTALSADVTL